jgi:hypothetical protein
MARLTILLFIVASAVAAVGQATTVCPWVTSGTAERLLGGEVSVTAHVESATAGSCSFVRQSGSSASSIEILVGLKDTHPCPQDSIKLRALGNAAVQCHHIISPAQQSDQIAGRIRNISFVVTMINIPDATREEPSDPRLADSYGASPIERLAEVVVGNLY